MHDLTHASWFSGVGGLDLGLERAGWRTVSFSEINPYASAVLAERWPRVPNLGDITRLSSGVQQSGRASVGEDATAEHSRRHRGPDWTDATLWTGGFPCQDLSVAGKRRGLAGERSGLAFAFLDLVERHRPPAVLLENVPGLLSSHAGRDLGVLLGRLGELRYGWAFRVLDAQWFGVPQRRRRVFILALDLERHPDESSAGQVLAVGTRCGRDHQAEREARTGVAARPGDRAGVVSETGRGWWTEGDTTGALRAAMGQHGSPDHAVYGGFTSDTSAAARTERGAYNASAKFGQWDGPDDAAGNLSARDYKSSNHLIVDGASPDPDRTGGLDGRMEHRASTRSDSQGSGFVREVRSGEVRGPSPQPRLARQPTGEPPAAMSELPQPNPRASEEVSGMREAPEGPGSVQQALHPVQEVGRPDEGGMAEARDMPLRTADSREGSMSSPLPESASSWTVRRLTPSECEALMGWPQGHTIVSEWKGKRYSTDVPQRAPDGLAGRLDGGQRLGSVGSGDGGPDDNDARSGHLIAHTLTAPGAEGGRRDKIPIVADTGHAGAGGGPVVDPLGLDSHRYRCCGNGVVAPVAEWLGWRLRRYMEGTL